MFHAAAPRAGGLLLASGTPQAGPIGLAVIVLLGVALFLLMRSMNKHMRRVPRSFDDRDDSADDGRGGTRARRARQARSGTPDRDGSHGPGPGDRHESS